MGLVGLALVLGLAPFLTNNLATLTNVFIAGTAAIGWNIIGGFTGYASFGSRPSSGWAAYTAAVLVARGPRHLRAAGAGSACWRWRSCRLSPPR